MTESTVAVPGGELYVRDEGTPGGPPIVLMHAGISHSEAWDALVPMLGEAGYRVVRYDLRGFGRSTTEAVDASNRADLIAVLDGLGIGRTALVGNSAGGQVAIDVAVEYPDRIVAVVGVAAGLSGFDGGASSEEQTLLEEGERLESADPPDVAAIADWDVRYWVDGPGQPADRVAPEVRKAVRRMDTENWTRPWPDPRPIRLDPPANDRLGDLRCPVLAVAGALDESSSVATARHLEANAPAARAVILPDVAHMIGMEAPDRLAALIVDFLAPLPRWS